MKVLIVGLGSIGQRHLRNLRERFGSKLEVLAHRVLKRQEVLTPKLEIRPGVRLEEEYGVRTFESLEAALAESPRLAFICNPSSIHVPAARAAAEAGCHLFIEKPVSASLDGLPELADLCERKKLAAFVGHQLRFHPALRLLQQTVASGVLGEVLSVRCEVAERLTDWHRYEDYRTMYAARRALGGGVVLSQIHELDYLYWLFGLPESVHAVGGKLSDLEIDVEDSVGAVLSARLGNREVPILLQMDFVQRPPSRGCKVTGTRGKAEIDLIGGAFSRQLLEEPAAAVTRFDGFDRNQMYRDELAHFLDCVETGAKPLVDLRDAMNGLRVALALRQSLEERGTIRLR